MFKFQTEGEIDLAMAWANDSSQSEDSAFQNFVLLIRNMSGGRFGRNYVLAARFLAQVDI